METLQLNIEKNQFVGLLQTLSASDKLEMYSVLKKSLLCDRMENLLDTFDDDELSMETPLDEITTRRSEVSVENLEGCLHSYANPALWKKEQRAWEDHIIEKYGHI